jgi:excisionase family DNA binding protein
MVGDLVMEFLTVKETAQLLRVSPITVRRYIASGQLAAERVGRGIRVRREAIEEFVTPIEPDDERSEPFTMDDPLWEIVGIGRSEGQNDVARNKHRYLADAYLSEIHDPEDDSGPDELPVKPFTMDDPLWSVFGTGESDDPIEVAENKYDYLADAYLSDQE